MLRLGDTFVSGFLLASAGHMRCNHKQGFAQLLLDLGLQAVISRYQYRYECKLRKRIVSPAMNKHLLHLLPPPPPRCVQYHAR